MTKAVTARRAYENGESCYGYCGIEILFGTGGGLGRMFHSQLYIQIMRTGGVVGIGICSN
jgi:hypothetical protein